MESTYKTSSLYFDVRDGHRYRLLFQLIWQRLSINPFIDISHHKRTLTNSVNPDQTLHFAASDRCLHCLHKMQEFL